jgi:hypothetical protein
MAVNHTFGRTAALGGGYLLLFGCSFALAVATPPGMGDKGVAVVTLPFFIVGLLIVRRYPRNAVGWILVALALTCVVAINAGDYSVLVYRAGDRLPLGRLAAALAPAWAPVLVLLPLPLVLFPDGCVPPGRWRLVFWGYLALVAAFVTSLLVADSNAFTDGRPRIDSKGEVAAVTSGWFNNPIVNVVLISLYASLVLAMVVYQVHAYRRATGDRRQQLKWFLLGGSVALGGLILAAQWNVFSPLFICVIALPLGIGFGILKYRLYDIDRLISRTISYAVLTALLVGVFLALVVLATRVLPFSSPVAVAASTLAAAALFNPLRRRVQAMVDHRFNRTRYDAAATAAGFGARLRQAIELEAVRAELLDAVGRTVAPAHASVWLSGEPVAGEARSAPR